jgi:acetylornithine deacetylase/succinyl-diaminopimelate desuccinylase-like protein
VTNRVGEVTDLLQHLIRNACVNDGTPASGQEVRNADLLTSYLGTSGLDVERFEATPGRSNIVARIEGTDPGAPALMLMGHLDVVPVNPDGWRRDPFGGELVDGEVWGRGAVDMLCLTASMAVAFRSLADAGFRPRGTLIYLGVADEEALGTHGAKWMLEHHPDAVRTDYVVTEFGGAAMPLPSASGPKLPIMVAEKGTFWCRLVVKGTPGHGSLPFRSDNALVKAAEVVRRVAEFRPDPRIHDAWRGFIQGADLPPELAAALLDPAGLESLVESHPDATLARMIHACTHTTFAPTIAHGGVKTNVIPDRVELQLDIRTLPGERGEDTRAMLEAAIGPDLLPSVEIAEIAVDESTASPQDTPLFDSIARATEALMPGATALPFIIMGATDSRFFRRAGVTAYGAGLFSDRITFAEFAAMFHGDDERIDQESLRLQTELWDLVARDLVG